MYSFFPTYVLLKNVLLKDPLFETIHPPSRKLSSRRVFDKFEATKWMGSSQNLTPRLLIDTRNQFYQLFEKRKYKFTNETDSTNLKTINSSLRTKRFMRKDTISYLSSPIILSNSLEKNETNQNGMDNCLRLVSVEKISNAVLAQRIDPGGFGNTDLSKLQSDSQYRNRIQRDIESIHTLVEEEKFYSFNDPSKANFKVKLLLYLKNLKSFDFGTVKEMLNFFIFLDQFEEIVIEFTILSRPLSTLILEAISDHIPELLEYYTIYSSKLTHAKVLFILKHVNLNYPL